MRTSVVWLALIAIPVVFGAAALAQTPTGTLQGVVEDTSGGAVPGASVTITHAATNESRTLSTDEAGRYGQPFLLPGTYTIRVTKEGFRPARSEEVKLDVGQNRSVDFRLEIGVMTQEVRVDAAPPPLDFSSSSLGQVIENKRILDLPLNGRSAFALANLTPGVIPIGGGATPWMGGGRNAASEVEIDGVTVIPVSGVKTDSGCDSCADLTGLPYQIFVVTLTSLLVMLKSACADRLEM